jgi:hypothetical protein
MTAREHRLFVRPKSKSNRNWRFVGEGMYKEHGGCPSGGVVVNRIYQGKQCVVVIMMLP